MLNSFDPYLQIDFVSSPREALEKLEKEEYDCIISDYKMPEMDGIQLAIRIREESDVPFILYTGQGSEEVAEAAFAAGIDDYLRKEIEPAHYQVLARRIRAAVESYQAEYRLREREQELSWVIDNSIDGIFRVEMDRGVTRFNPAFLKFFGYSPEELQSMGMRMLELIHDEDKAQFFSELDDLTSRRLEKYASLNRWHTKSGETIWLDSNITALIQDEKFIGVDIIARDVTKRMKIERDLKESENRYRNLFENMVEGFALHRIILDENGMPTDYVFLEFNDAFERLTGLKREEALGRKVTEVLPGIEDDPADWIGRYGKVAVGGVEIRFEQYAEPLERWYSVTAYRPMKNHFAVIFEEITEQKRIEKELRESEEKYRVFLESSMDAVYVAAEEGIIYTNQSGADLLGYSDPSEVIGLDPINLVPPEQRKELTERLSRAWEGTEETRKYEMQLLRKDGTTIDIETFSCNIMFDGRPARLAFDRDITERKRIEEKLKQNEATLLALHRHARDLAGCLSLEEVYEHTIRIMTETLRFPRVDILMVEGNDLKQVTASGSIPLGVQIPLNGKGVTVKAIREKRSQLINDVSQSEDYIYATGGPQSEPFDGYPLSRAELASPIIVEGEAVGVLNVENTQVDAFTEQNKAFLELLAIHVASAIERLGKTYELERLIEERTTELKEQTLLAQVYMDVAHVIFLVLDPEGEILLLNQKGCDTLGYTQEEVVGLNWIDTFIPRRLREDIIRLHKQGVSGNIELAESFENPVLTRYGEERIIEWHNAFIRDSTGKAVSSISSGIDVTDRRDMQSALAESEQMSAAGKVAAMVGHDLRGPLQTIKNAIFLMEKDPDSAEGLRKTISEAVDYAANMLEELRLNIGDASLQLQEVNLGSLIRRAVVEASTPDSVKTELQIADGLDSVHVDPLKMRRVLDNLIRNSIEAMPEGGSLDVSAVCEDHGVLIRVKDSGMGIPEDLRPDLFKAFITTKSKGMGLGLAFCKRAVEAHGGTITVESEVGVGTTFTVRLPVNPEAGNGKDKA
jgi:PAS domain S-box-containing protein